MSSGRHVSMPLGICPHDSSYFAVWAPQVWGRGGGQGQPGQRKRRGTKNKDVRGDRVDAVVDVRGGVRIVWSARAVDEFVTTEGRGAARMRTTPYSEQARRGSVA